MLGVIFCLVMGLGVRPLLARASTAYDEAGRIPSGWTALIFAGVLVAAYATEEIGIALIFGAFVMGLVMPRHAGLTEDVTRRVEDFVVILLLPLFFAITGLRTDIGLLDRPELWLITGVLLAIALLGKLFGAALAARLAGFNTRESTVIGVLMNTRGLTELIVLSLALEKGVISDALFAMLVIMALVTTVMTSPMLKALDPKNELGTPVEEELSAARSVSMAEFPELAPREQALLVAPQADAALGQLLALAEPLARSEPPRELILAKLVRPPRGAAVRGGLQTENRLLEQAAEEVNLARRELIERGVAARAVAFISADPGEGPVAPGRPPGGRLPARRRAAAGGRRGRAARPGGHGAARGPLRRGGAGRPGGRARAARPRGPGGRPRSAAPSTTGPRSSWVRGPARPRAPRSSCSAPPGRPRTAPASPACSATPDCWCSSTPVWSPSRWWPSRGASGSWRWRRTPGCSWSDCPGGGVRRDSVRRAPR